MLRYKGVKISTDELFDGIRTGKMGLKEVRAVEVIEEKAEKANRKRVTTEIKGDDVKREKPFDFFIVLSNIAYRSD